MFGAEPVYEVRELLADGRVRVVYDAEARELVQRVEREQAEARMRRRDAEASVGVDTGDAGGGMDAPNVGDTGTASRGGSFMRSLLAWRPT